MTTWRAYGLMLTTCDCKLFRVLDYRMVETEVAVSVTVDLSFAIGYSVPRGLLLRRYLFAFSVVC